MDVWEWDMWKRALSAAFIFSVTACAPNAQAPETAVTTADDVGVDAFGLAIETERWSVMIDNARNLFVDGGGMMDADEQTRAHEALRSGALSLAMLRDGICTAAVVDIETCAAYVVPDWAVSWVAETPPLDVLQARSNWLGEALQPFEEAVCSDGDGGRSIECMVE
jgi:hypothetical protein